MADREEDKRHNEEIIKLDNSDSNIKYLFKINYDYLLKKEIHDSFLIPKQPKKIEEKKRVVRGRDAEILAPFGEVFFDDNLMDDLIMHTSVIELLDGKKSVYYGNILYGPPGTGSQFSRGRHVMLLKGQELMQSRFLLIT